MTNPTTIFANETDTINAHQFFIQILPDNELVNCGRFREFDTLAITKIYFVKDDSSDLWTIDDALQLIFERQHGHPLFYIHGFFAASPKLTQRTVLAYKKFFLEDSTNQTSDIIHIVWDSKKLSYKNSRNNIKSSQNALAEIIDLSAKKMSKRINLMCHSMGNQFLVETIKSGKLTEKKIDKLVLAAPDFDMGDFDVYQNGISFVAEQILVLFSKKDKVLAASRLKNQERRLGQQLPKRIEKDNFLFIDCTKMKIGHSIIAKLNKHTYFLASDEVRMKIHDFL